MSMILNGVPTDGKQIVEWSEICCEKGGDGVETVKADIFESLIEYNIILTVPGIDDLTVEIKKKDHQVLIRGERVKPILNQFGPHTVWSVTETSYGPFWRRFRFPTNAIMDRVKFHLDNDTIVTRTQGAFETLDNVVM
ncbi:22.0 kDa class IV heat shock protein-like [Silene latifolia]|uniref:22.0 kDa class IV heat shock protein-like n=1 Tax=Silene latifolia TaxID=37657 RepID=UPI003D7864B7